MEQTQESLDLTKNEPDGESEPDDKIEPDGKNKPEGKNEPGGNNEPDSIDETCSADESKPLKQRLRPRKAKPTEPDVVIVSVGPSKRSRKTLKKPGPKSAATDTKTVARKTKPKTSTPTPASQTKSVEARAEKSAGSNAGEPIEIPDGSP
jgi:hypothetical protein